MSRLRWSATVAVLVVVGVAVATALAAVGGPQRARVPPVPTSPTTTDRAALASAVVADLEQALRRRDGAAAARLAADPSAAQQLRALGRNIRRLRVADLSLRHLGEAASDGSAVGPSEDPAWTVEAELTWRLAGVDRRTATLEVPLVLVHSRDGALVASLRADTGRVPLWWGGPVTVRRSSQAVVVSAASASRQRTLRQLASAVATVRRTLPAWRGPVVVEVPASGSDFRRTTGADPAAVRAIAALTTTADGSALPSAPVRVHLNPRVYRQLEPDGRRIVLAHEVTHVALGAATTRMPTWLAEGAADYVALRDSRLPDRVLAAQVVRLVRSDGLPAGLPGPAEFSGANEDVGAWYEAAWLAARVVAERYGEDALLDFYRAADRAGSTDRAFRRVLGTTEGRFVEEWRAELRAVAG